MANETQAHTPKVIPVQPSSSGRAIAAACSTFAKALFVFNGSIVYLILLKI